MSWREQYQKGSFRGVPFRTQFHERTGGRRISIHEFPSRDEPLVEDLGRRARQFSLDLHVIGNDYMAARDELIDALEAPGPGMLVHPWYGSMMLSVLDFSSSESTEDGGVCWFQVTFTETGLPAPSPVTVSAGQATGDEADRLLEQAPELFADRFSIDGAAGFVEDAASELVSGMAEVATIAAGLRGGAGPALRAFEAGLSLLPADLASLMRAPINLSRNIVGLVIAVSALGGGGGKRRKLAPLELMLDWQPTSPDFPDRTPQRRRETANRNALLHLFRSACAAELARAASRAGFSSLDEARAVREEIATRFDALALEAADRGDDDAAAQFDRLRLALVRDIDSQGVTLARIYQVELAQTEPALVLAHRLHGSARRGGQGLQERAAALVARNRLSHPGFVPAGVPIDILTDRGAA